jgi:hypothetical protein
LSIPAILDGKSLVPLMKNPSSKVKEFSVSQYPRSSDGVETDRQGYAEAKVMGYSIRNKNYRYTVWMTNGYRSTQPYDEKLLLGTELYDYKKDPFEKVNVVDERAYKMVSAEMKSQMLQFFKSQLR